MGQSPQKLHAPQKDCVTLQLGNYNDDNNNNNNNKVRYAMS